MQATPWPDDKVMELICISDENPPLDRIPDGDSLLDHARVKDQRSNLTRIDPYEELK